ncbi:hypothetical protein HAX54_035846 [Datura stramonium]|uniref:Uncharacterized protein n=1 Tax=Datura stramonium TaxID=4076 RepID=A0ABS8SFR0_DATST|nr:hypothetical protein [Datura stramonium]
MQGTTRQYVWRNARREAKAQRSVARSHLCNQRHKAPPAPRYQRHDAEVIGVMPKHRRLPSGPSVDLVRNASKDVWCNARQGVGLLATL